jgi:hypothetical protein
MKENINKQLELLEKANVWVREALEGEKQKKAYRNLVNCRRRLKRKKYVLDSNPAAAMYGESQVGKSYLVSSLLSEAGKPFGITDENGVVHNFIEEINPPGGGSESTSLVTRFSVYYQPVNPRFPVKAVLLSPADIVLVLCDSFYNDINLRTSQNIHFMSIEEINEEVFRIKQQLNNNQAPQTYLTEDDVLDIQEYFNDHFQKADKVISSMFFEEISLIVAKTRPEEWKDIFSLLWNRNEIFTNLFGQLIVQYQTLNFAQEVFLPVESVLYRYGTLLDVKRLREIYTQPNNIEPDYTPNTEVYLAENQQTIVFQKSYLCALTAELVFSQSETLLNSKPFLRETDLLDFPGARARMNTQLEAVENQTIPDLLLRGKVACLFNKYSKAEKINILLFCAKHEQTAQRIMPQLLHDWVNMVVGKTPEERERFIDDSKISPLFIIGTFFNVNLQFNPIQDRPNDDSSLKYRWLQRFETTLTKEYIETQNPLYSWFDKWTASQPFFSNIYLLRDFEKSERPSDIFRGFNVNKTESEEVPTPQYPNFRQELRQSFLDYDFVKRHFANPAESWDEAATINKDGTGLIIKRLTVAADNINQARMAKMLAELKDISKQILDELRRHYHSNDKDEELRNAIATVGDIQHSLDAAFNADGIKKYGQMMKELMVDESAVHQLYRKVVEDTEHRDTVNRDRYSMYRLQVPVINGDTAESYFERLCKHYAKTSEEQIQRFREELISREIDLDELIQGNADLIKNNALQLAEALIAFWLHDYAERPEHLTLRSVFDGTSALQDIKEMYMKLFDKLGLARRIADKIRQYVDRHDKTGLPYDIVGDISAELLNKCINTVGFHYFDEPEIEALQRANDENHLGLRFVQNAAPYAGSVEELFEKIDCQAEILQRHPEEMSTLPSYSNYLAWYNRLKTGFVAVCDIPTYDVAANGRLRTIIDECKTVNF